MSYGDIIKKAMEDKNLSLREVAEKCSDYGVSVTHSYIGKLKEGMQKLPSDDILIALSKVLEIEEDKLLIEAYLDIAPKPIVQFIKNTMNDDDIKNISKFLFNNLSYSIDNNKVSDVSLSDYVIAKNNFLINNSQNNHFTCKLEITDDSMEPLIPKGSHVIISRFPERMKDEYISTPDKKTDEYAELYKKIHNDTIGFKNVEDGDIVAVWNIDSGQLLIRNFQGLGEYEHKGDLYQNTRYTLFPMNGKYPIMNFDLEYTYFNLVSINNNTINFNYDLIDFIKKQNEHEINGVKVIPSLTCPRVCILGKVAKIIKSID